MAAIAHNFRLPITTEATLKDFVRLAWGVEIPDKQVCANHTTPWQAFADAYFARYPVSVWFASRGFGGKSYLLATLSLTEAVTLKADTNILGGSGAQSKRVLEHETNLWHYKNSPRDLIQGEASTVTRLSNGAKIEALMASQASVRGPHPQRLRLDEIDEMDLTILDAAMGQPMARNGIPAQTVMSSTRQYADGTMQKILQRAAEKGWRTYEWCFKENMQPHGWLSLEQIEQKKAEITMGMWLTEYENQEPSPESRAIQSEAVEKMFDKSLGEFEGAAHEYIEIEPPQADATYSHGADWARKNDWTIIPTIREDTHPRRVVAWERTGRLDWPVMIAKLDDRMKRYGGKAFHDGTGLGDVVAGYINSPAKSFIMAGRARADLLSEYINACEKGDLIYPFIRYAYNEHKYASVEDVFSSGEGHHLPDSISGGALAWRASKRPTAADLVDFA
jgi:hypothetical protein